MSLHLNLKDDSPWADLASRLATADPASARAATLTDMDDPGPEPRLLLHRCPLAAATEEVGFFLEDSSSTLVEISPGAATSRESMSTAWNIALEIGLQPVRLATGESSLLTRLRGIEDPRLDPPEQAARLAIWLGEVLDRGLTGPRELDLLVGHARPGEPSPFDTLNALDAPLRQRLLEEARKHRGLVHLPAGLRRDLRSGTGLAERRVALDFQDGLARIRLIRPQALNAVDLEMLTELDSAWQEAEARSGIEAIVLEGSGPAFMAGVDLDRILAWIESDRLDRIVDFVRAGHRFLDRVDRSRCHTLVRLHGLAVGAGAEFCAAFDTVVATPRGSIGFPETSIGIYPAMGGTQRLPRRVGYPIARWWVLGGALVAAPRARALGMVDAVVDESAIDEEIRQRARTQASGTRAAWQEHALDSRLEPVFSTVSEATLAELIDPGQTTDPELARLSRRLRHRGVIALRAADQLLRMSRTNTLAEGLAAEIELLPQVYRTPEAIAGIRRAVRGAGRSRPR